MVVVANNSVSTFFQPMSSINPLTADGRPKVWACVLCIKLPKFIYLSESDGKERSLERHVKEEHPGHDYTNVCDWHGSIVCGDYIEQKQPRYHCKKCPPNALYVLHDESKKELHGNDWHPGPKARNDWTTSNKTHMIPLAVRDDMFNDVKEISALPGEIGPFKVVDNKIVPRTFESGSTNSLNYIEPHQGSNRPLSMMSVPILTPEIAPTQQAGGGNTVSLLPLRGPHSDVFESRPPASTTLPRFNITPERVLAQQAGFADAASVPSHPQINAYNTRPSSTQLGLASDIQPPLHLLETGISPSQPPNLYSVFSPMFPSLGSGISTNHPAYEQSRLSAQRHQAQTYPMPYQNEPQQGHESLMTPEMREFYQRSVAQQQQAFEAEAGQSHQAGPQFDQPTYIPESLNWRDRMFLPATTYQRPPYLHFTEDPSSTVQPTASTSSRIVPAQQGQQLYYRPYSYTSDSPLEEERYCTDPANWHPDDREYHAQTELNTTHTQTRDATTSRAPQFIARVDAQRAHEREIESRRRYGLWDGSADGNGQEEASEGYEGAQ